MRKLIIILIELIMTTMVIPVSAQQLGGEQVFSYRTESEKENFDKAVIDCTRRHFGFPKGYRMNGTQGMDYITWKAVDLVILKGNTLIPVMVKNGKRTEKKRHAFRMSDRELDRLMEGIRNGKYDVKVLVGEQFEDMHFSQESENENNPQVNAHYQTTVRYTNGPDINVPFLRKEAEVFKPDRTRSFSKGYAWKILPGPKGVKLAKERKMKIDLGLRFTHPRDVKRVYDGYDKLAMYYAKNGVPSTLAAESFEKKLLDDHKLTPDDIRFIPEGFYTMTPSKNGFKDEVTWKSFEGIRLVLISHEEKPLTECDGREEEKKKNPEVKKEEKKVGVKEVVEKPVEKGVIPCSEGDVITNITYNYYGTIDSTKIDEDTVVVEPKPLLRGFLIGMYGTTLHDDEAQQIYGGHIGYYPFPDKQGFARRIGFGVGYEGGKYFSSREVNHNDLGGGDYGKSFVERDNAHFDGVFASLHFIPVSNNVQKDWLSVYGSVGYRWYKADEFSVGRMYNSGGSIIEEEQNLITPLSKEMLMFGFGIHLKPRRWFTIGVDFKLGKSAGWDYGIDNMPAQYSGADNNFMMKSIMGTIGFCF